MSNRPNPSFTREQALSFLQQHGIIEQIAWLGYRSAGSRHDRYDDTIALLTPDQYIEYKATILHLAPGVYPYKKGLQNIHHLGSGHADKAILVWLNGNIGKDYPAGSDKALPYWAFRLADGSGALDRSTFSPDHWLQARAAGYRAMDQYAQDHILFLLHQL